MSSPRLRRELHLHHVALSSVTPVDYRGNDLPEITWTRLNQRYRDAIELAGLVLRSTSIEHDEGRVRSAAFLVNMNQLFEDFVVTALRPQLGVGPTTLVQGAKGRRLHLDEAEQVRLEPDLSLWQNGRCRFVADCKYKRVNVAGIKHPDLYQLLAYTAATGLDAGLLIYAAGEAEPRHHRVRLLGKTLAVTAIDLSGEPESILEEVARIADLIEATLSRWTSNV